MLIIVGLGMFLNSFWTNHGVLGASADYSIESLLVSTNERRSAADEPPLTIDDKLTAAAQAKAIDMVTRDYWSHDTPDGKSPWTFINNAGYGYKLAGENLAYGFTSADETIGGWMNSPEHRANILNADYRNVGFGAATKANFQGKGLQTVIVAMYGEPSTSAANVTFTVPSPIAPPKNSDTLSNLREPATQLVSRVQLLSGDQPAWTTFVVTLIASSAALVLVIRHGFFLRRLFSKSEMFVIHHPLLDLLAVLLATIGFVLTRTSGFIR